MVDIFVVIGWKEGCKRSKGSVAGETEGVGKDNKEMAIRGLAIAAGK